MTLIITALAKNKVVQASDRRLTRLDGSLFDDQANKVICVRCNNAMFSVAYTGIARIGGKRTDEWIADYFDAVPDIALKPIHEIRRELTDYATATFARHQKPMFLDVVMAGFHLYLEPRSSYPSSTRTCAERLQASLRKYPATRSAVKRL